MDDQSNSSSTSWSQASSPLSRSSSNTSAVSQQLLGPNASSSLSNGMQPVPLTVPVEVLGFLIGTELQCRYQAQTKHRRDVG